MYKFFCFETHYFQTMIKIKQRSILLFLKQNIVSVFYRLQYFSSSSAFLPSNIEWPKWVCLARNSCSEGAEEFVKKSILLTTFFWPPFSPPWPLLIFHFRARAQRRQTENICERRKLKLTQSGVWGSGKKWGIRAGGLHFPALSDEFVRPL